MEKIEKTFKNVKTLYISKAPEGYVVNIGGQKIQLPNITNFEFRMEKPVKIVHLYFGTETGKMDDFSFNISFGYPCKIRTSDGAPRYYFYISPEKQNHHK